MADSFNVQPWHSREIQHALPLLAAYQARLAWTLVCLGAKGPKHEAPWSRACFPPYTLVAIAYELPYWQSIPVPASWRARKSMAEAKWGSIDFSWLWRSSHIAWQLLGFNHWAMLFESTWSTQSHSRCLTHVHSALQTSPRHRWRANVEHLIRRAILEAESKLWATIELRLLAPIQLQE